LGILVVLSTGTLKPRAQNQKRLTLVLEYLNDPNEGKHLRKATLCLRVSMAAVSITAKKPTEEGAVPTLVRLGKGDVQAETSKLTQEIISLLRNDPALDTLDTLIAFLTTQGHINIRFQIYLEYPTMLWKLTKKFNRTGYMQEFLEEPEKNLDAGYSVLLREEACKHDSDADRISYLASHQVQAEIVGVLEAVTGKLVLPCSWEAKPRSECKR
jgi:hypothetical protein